MEQKWRKQTLCSSLLLISVLTSACSTLGKSMGAGAATGAALGMGTGLLADPGPEGKNRVRNVLIGTAAGGVLGAGTGYIADRYIKDEKDDAYQRGKKDFQKEVSSSSDLSPSSQPRLIPPRTEARWMPDQVRGQTFIPGHFEFQIVEGAKWDVQR